MRPLPILATVALTAACAGGSSGPAPGSAPAPAPQPSPAATAVMQQAAKVEPPKPKEADVTGNYAVDLTYQGQPVQVTLQLAKDSGGAWIGQLVADQIPPIPLYNVKRNGDGFTAGLTSPDGSTVTMEFTITGDDVKGAFKTSTGDGSPMTGKKIKG